jgi:tryptophanase
MSGDPVPRRAYTQSHVDYVVEAVKQVWDRCDAVRGFRIVEQAPSLRHFTAKLDRCVASLSAI